MLPPATSRPRRSGRRSSAAAQEQLRQAQKMEAVGQLTGGVAHDFNNLLTIIKPSIDLLRRPSLPRGAPRARYVDAISETVDRAAKLTEPALAFARRQALKPEVFDVAERIRAITDMLRTIVGAHSDRDRAQPASPACRGRRRPVRDGARQHGRQCARRHGRRGRPLTDRRSRTLAGDADARGHARRPGRFVAVSLTRHRCRHPSRQARRNLRAVLHDQGGRQGHGAGPRQVYGFAKQSGGDVDGRERGRPRHHLHALPAAG